MNRCTYSPAARLDLIELHDYIARDRPAAAARFIDRLEQTCAWLAINREIGERVDWVRQGARMFPVGNHIIFYTIVEQDIQVLRVVHGARDFNLLF